MLPKMARKSRTKPRFIIRTLEDSVELLDQSLVAAYLDTNYRVAWPDQNGTVVRIGDQDTPFIQHLASMHFQTFALITADNPGSRMQSDQENLLRRLDLQARLVRSVVYMLPSVHFSKNLSWPAEYGFLVAGINPSFAVNIARKFGQNAIVWWQQGDSVALWWL